jgi:DNA-binding NarL/FixJ family response regulator
VVIADDQALFREGLRTLLSTRSEVDVVGEAANGEEVLAIADRLHPDVVLMDLQMPLMDGIQATVRLREKWPSIPVLVLTTFDDDANLFGALRAGASGYLLKDVSSETLISAITAAARGEAFL